MKIGIITFWTSKDNYGQHLQSFALQQYLRNHGHSPFLISYQDNPKKEASFKWTRILTYIFKFPKYVAWYLQQKTLKRRQLTYQQSVAKVDRKFDVFFKNYITHTESVYTEQMLANECPKADAYICGSDQVWGGDWAYYLDFAPDDKPKIAYAPSLGGLTTFKPEVETRMSELLKRFAFVGMREQSGVEVCHRLGREDAVRVVDPTLLLTKEDYDKIRINTKDTQQKPYLFAYILGNPMDCDMKDIYAYAESRGLDVKYATSGKADDYDHIYPQIGEWIDLIANADIVVTNSFHGTVFSLIYEVPFVTILLNDGYERMNTRVVELLECANLKGRIYNNSFNGIPSEVSFSAFNNYRLTEEKRTEAYLKRIID